MLQERTKKEPSLEVSVPKQLVTSPVKSESNSFTTSAKVWLIEFIINSSPKSGQNNHISKIIFGNNHSLSNHFLLESDESDEN